MDSVTLVFQQAAVLECNLNAPIGKYCGAMGTDMWSKEEWDVILNKEQVRAYNIEDCCLHQQNNSLSLLLTSYRSS